jgi:3-hydroxy-5-methyl-1-naphthoate 3-O-methyltransferase
MTYKDLRLIPNTDPSDLIRLRDGIFAADLLVTAIGHLDFFTEIDAHKLDFNSVCNHFKIDHRCTDVMLTYFASLELITIENGIYKVSNKAAEFLLKTSNWSLVPYFSTQLERPIVEKMLDALKTGKPQSWGAKKEEQDWAKAMEKSDFAQMFTAGMDSRGAYFAPGIAKSFDFNKYTSIIDIGGASGIYVASIIEHYPHLKGGVLEKSPVDKIAEISISQKGKQDKITVFEGDMFNSIPLGFDIHLFSHVMHDWNIEQNSKLIKNSFETLNNGGVMMIHDAHINPDKTGPVSVAEYSVLLMFSTYGKCYSIGELGKIMESEGFKDIREIKTIGNRSIIIGEKK